MDSAVADTGSQHAAAALTANGVRGDPSHRYRGRNLVARFAFCVQRCEFNTDAAGSVVVRCFVRYRRITRHTPVQPFCQFRVQGYTRSDLEGLSHRNIETSAAGRHVEDLADAGTQAGPLVNISTHGNPTMFSRITMTVAHRFSPMQ